MDDRRKFAHVMAGLLVLAACMPQAGPTAGVGGPTPAGEMPTGEAMPATETPVPATETPAPATETVSEDDLANTQWSLLSIGALGAALPLLPGSTITLTFEAANQVTGSGGCNSYGGEYRVEGNTLVFSNVTSTLMACLDTAVTEQETLYLQALHTAGAFELVGDQLTIWYGGGQGMLNFVSAATASAPQETAVPAQTTPHAVETSPGPVETMPGTTSSGPEVYIDDRSGPVEMLQSYFNAINRHEYTRAYAYWDNPDQAGTFESFQQGYAATQSFQLTTGPVGGDAGAGQVYYTVPVVLEARTTGGAVQHFAGCYVLHLSQPGVQGEPPFRPLGIDSAVVEEMRGEASTESLLRGACRGQNVNSIPPEPPADPADISADNYLDNRSGPVELLRSYFNVINRHEYVRAYAYWEEGAAVSSFAEFEQGYANTRLVELETGPVADGVAAGNRYYDVPVLLRVQLTDGDMQFFAGCYRLHLGSPGAQAEPPFRPLGIMTANIQQMASEAAAAALLALPCPK